MHQPVLLSCSGTHGTGKTTTVEAVCEALPAVRITKVSEVARTALKKYKFQVNQDADEAGQLAFFASYMMELISALRGEKPAEVIISDRCPYDMCAYTLTNPNIGPSVRSLCVEFVEKFSKLTQKHILFHFPLGVIPLVGDEVRKSDPNYQILIDEVLQSLYSSFPPPQMIRLYDGNQVNRVEEISAHALKLLRGW